MVKKKKKSFHISFSVARSTIKLHLWDLVQMVLANPCVYVALVRHAQSNKHYEGSN